MKYNSIGQQLIAKAQELDPNYKPDKFNDMSEAIDVILKTTGGGESVSPTLNLIDPEEGTVRTTITEQEKINLEKGLYNQVLYGDLTDEHPFELYTPSKICNLDGGLAFINFNTPKMINNKPVFETVSLYSLDIGPKNTNGEYPIAIEKNGTFNLGSGGGSGGSSYTPLELTMVKDETEGLNFKLTLTAEQKATFIKACQDNEPIIAIVNLPLLDGIPYKVPISLASLVNETYMGFASYSMVTNIYSGWWLLDESELKLALIENSFTNQWGIYFDRDVEMTNRLAFANDNSFLDFASVQGEYVYFDKINGKSIIHEDSTINNYYAPTTINETATPKILQSKNSVMEWVDLPSSEEATQVIIRRY